MGRGGAVTGLLLASQKGGVGKTSLSVSLASVFAQSRRTLLVDVDPQGSATHLFGVHPADRDLGWLLDMDEERSPTDALVTEVCPGLDLLPANNDSMLAAESKLQTMVGGHRALQIILDDLTKQVGPYDVVVVDTPSNLGIMTVNGMCAVDWVVTPFELEGLSTMGVARISDLLAKCRRMGLTKAQFLGLIANQYEPRLALTKIMEQQVARTGLRCFLTKIPRTVRLREQTLLGRPLVLDSPDLPVSRTLTELADEVLDAMKGGHAQ